MYAWIMTTSPNEPVHRFAGYAGFDLDRVFDLEHAREIFEEYCEAVGTRECTGRLYSYSDATWSRAEVNRGVPDCLGTPVTLVVSGKNGTEVIPA